MEVDTFPGISEDGVEITQIPEVQVNGEMIDDMEIYAQDESNNYLQKEAVDVNSMLYVQGSRLCADLGELKLTQIPDQVFDLDQLVCLSLSNNRITEVLDERIALAL